MIFSNEIKRLLEIMPNDENKLKINIGPTPPNIINGENLIL